MCSPFDPVDCVTQALSGAIQTGINAVFGLIADGLRAGVKDLATILAGWIIVPSTDVCQGDIASQCAASPAGQMRSWMLPITILIAVIGLTYQGIAMAITRKGEPLLQAIRGLWNTALWGAVGIAGTQLALKAGDSYSLWILQQGIIGNSADPTSALGSKIGDMGGAQAGIAIIVQVLLLIPMLFVTLIQILLMIFREGSVVILAGLLQLAAAGSFTRATSGWMPKVLSWMLALISYKAVAATVYSTGFLLMAASGGRNFIMGLAVMVLSVVALPALMKFFTWTVGSINSSSGGLGLLGAAGAAGVHAAASLRSVGGFSATDHARYMEQHGPSGGEAGPSGAAPPGPAPTPGPSGASTVSATTTATTTSTTTGAAAAGSSGTAAASTGAASGAAGAAAAGTAATGVGIPVAAAIVVTQAAAKAGKQAADTAADSMQGS
jgi:hypothetical protein